MFLYSRDRRVSYEPGVYTNELDLLMRSSVATTWSDMVELICMDKPWGKLKSSGGAVLKQDEAQNTSIVPLCQFYYQMLKDGGNILLCLTAWDLGKWRSALVDAGFRVDAAPIVCARDASQCKGRSDRVDAIVSATEFWISAWKKANKQPRIMNLDVRFVFALFDVVLFNIHSLYSCVI
jgi:hypothetical protein